MTRFDALALCCACALISPALAANEPAVATPIRLVVGFPPGGGTDGAARILAEKLPAELGQVVTVENRAGAGGTVGAQSVARATPDGSTLFFGTSAELLINPVTRKTAPYQVLTHFTPIAEVGSVTFLLVVPANSPANTVQDLIARARAQPGRLNFSSFGMGSTNHMINELFLSATGLTATHIPYQGSAQASAALLAGDVDFTFETTAVALPLLKSGRIKALATPSPNRLRDLPDLPTLRELGYPGVVAEGWMGVLAPAGAPRALVDRLNKAIVNVLRQPDVETRLTARGVNIVAGTPEAYRTMLASELARWRDVAQRSGISLD